MIDSLNTGIRNVRNVRRFIFENGAFAELETLLSRQRNSGESPVVFLVDEYFECNPKPINTLSCNANDMLVYVPTGDEPTTESIDSLLEQVWAGCGVCPCAVVGIGGVAH